MPVAKHSYEQTVSQISELKEKRDDLKAIVECYEDIFKAQNETADSLQPLLTGLDFTACKEKHADGRPFLNSENITIQWDLFDSLAERICTITKPLAKSDESGIENFSKLLAENTETWHKIVLGSVLEDSSPLKELAQNVDINYDTLIFISIQTLTPFIEKYAQKLREYIDSNVWLKGSCPVCGGEPLMGRLEEESGKRYLQCYLCRTNWEFARLECPFCDNNDQKKLHYFFDEDNKHRRVELCDQCKSYLKVIDTREVGDRISLVVENLATLPLDIVAKREGFTRDTNRLFGA
jgi:FdhE protein